MATLLHEQSEGIQTFNAQCDLAHTVPMQLETVSDGVGRTEVILTRTDTDAQVLRAHYSSGSSKKIGSSPVQCAADHTFTAVLERGGVGVRVLRADPPDDQQFRVEPPKPYAESNVREVYTPGGGSAGIGASGFQSYERDERTFRERIYKVQSDTEASQLDAWLALLNSIRIDTNIAGSKGLRNVKVPLADYNNAVATATADELAGQAIWTRANPEIQFV